MPPTTRDQARARAEQLASLPPELRARIVGHLGESLPDLAAVNAASRLFRGAPVEHALRARSRARGHERALPARLPPGVRTWTGELFARERVLQLARAHAFVAAAGGREEYSGGDPFAGGDERQDGEAFSAFVDADGRVHACGERLMFDADDYPGWFSPGAIGLDHLAEDRRHLGRPARVPSLDEVRVCALAAGLCHLLALSDTGAVYACGDNYLGQLGFKAADDDELFCESFGPVTALASQTIVGIAAGDEHSLALTAAGRVYSWGCESSGQLGHGDDTRISTQDDWDTYQWKPARIKALDGVRVGGLAAGGDHSLFVAAGGAVYSCGGSWHGQLGHGDPRALERPDELSTPTRIEALAGVRAVHASAGKRHSLAVDAAGAVHFFGNWNYRHGTSYEYAAPTDDVYLPESIDLPAGMRAVRVSAGRGYSAVLGADGRVYTFGSNREYGLGRDYWDMNLLVRVFEFEETRMVSCSFSELHALFVSASGLVYSCGETSAALGMGPGWRYDGRSDCQSPGQSPVELKYKRPLRVRVAATLGCGAPAPEPVPVRTP